ncbi:uncharacterized protein LOC143032289 [Oratosquilla oratoria]|uniref:uncharacterized protein LOC143032289 n=1 Tax=Oratosquilla oratoria TaxID=337810 RepID=UPI003F76AEA0
MALLLNRFLVSKQSPRYILVYYNDTKQKSDFIMLLRALMNTAILGGVANGGGRLAGLAVGVVGPFRMVLPYTSIQGFPNSIVAKLQLFCEELQTVIGTKDRIYQAEDLNTGLIEVLNVICDDTNTQANHLNGKVKHSRLTVVTWDSHAPVIEILGQVLTQEHSSFLASVEVVQMLSPLQNLLVTASSSIASSNGVENCPDICTSSIENCSNSEEKKNSSANLSYDLFSQVNVTVTKTEITCDFYSIERYFRQWLQPEPSTECDVNIHFNCSIDQAVEPCTLFADVKENCIDPSSFPAHLAFYTALQPCTMVQAMPATGPQNVITVLKRVSHDNIGLEWIVGPSLVLHPSACTSLTLDQLWKNRQIFIGLSKKLQACREVLVGYLVLSKSALRGASLGRGKNSSSSQQDNLFATIILVPGVDGSFLLRAHVPTQLFLPIPALLPENLSSQVEEEIDKLLSSLKSDPLEPFSDIRCDVISHLTHHFNKKPKHARPQVSTSHPSTISWPPSRETKGKEQRSRIRARKFGNQFKHFNAQRRDEAVNIQTGNYNSLNS